MPKTLWQACLALSLPPFVAAAAAQAQSLGTQVGREVAIRAHLQDGEEFNIPLAQLIDYGKQPHRIAQVPPGSADQCQIASRGRERQGEALASFRTDAARVTARAVCCITRARDLGRQKLQPWPIRRGQSGPQFTASCQKIVASQRKGNSTPSIRGDS